MVSQTDRHSQQCSKHDHTGRHIQSDKQVGTQNNSVKQSHTQQSYTQIGHDHTTTEKSVKKISKMQKIVNKTTLWNNGQVGTVRYTQQTCTHPDNAGRYTHKGRRKNLTKGKNTARDKEKSENNMKYRTRMYQTDNKNDKTQ